MIGSTQDQTKDRGEYPDFTDAEILDIEAMRLSFEQGPESGETIKVPGKGGAVEIETGSLEGEEFNTVEPQEPRTVAAADDIEVFDPEDLGKYENDADDYLYHVTTTTTADSILGDGLQAGFKSNFDGHDEYSQGRVFFTERGGIDYWMERLGEQFDNETVVVLRVEVDDLLGEIKTDPAGTRDAPVTSYYIEPQEGETESKTFTTMDGGALINPEFSPEKKAFKPLLKTRVDSYVKRDGTVVSSYEREGGKKPEEVRGLEKRTSMPHWSSVGWSRTFDNMEDTLFDMPRDDTQMVSKKDRRLAQYSDGQIGFMYEQAKLDKAEMGDEETPRLQIAMNLLRREVTKRGINSKEEAINLNLSGLNSLVDFSFFERVNKTADTETLQFYLSREIANEELRTTRQSNPLSRDELEKLRQASRTANREFRDAKETLVEDFMNDIIANELSIDPQWEPIAIPRIDLPESAGDLSLLNKDLKRITSLIWQLQNLRYAPIDGGDEARRLADYQKLMNTAAYRALGSLERGIRRAIREGVPLGSDIEQKFFGFDTGIRGEAEKQRGMSIYLSGLASDLEAEAERLGVELNEAVENKSEAYAAMLQGSRLSLEKQKELEDEYRKRFDEAEDAVNAWSDALTEAEIARDRAEMYGDLRVRKLSLEEKSRIAEIMTPTPSEAYVELRYDASGESWYDLSEDRKHDIRMEYRDHLVDSEFEIDEYREYARGRLLDEDDEISQTLSNWIVKNLPSPPYQESFLDDDSKFFIEINNAMSQEGVPKSIILEEARSIVQEAYDSSKSTESDFFGFVNQQISDLVEEMQSSGTVGGFHEGLSYQGWTRKNIEENASYELMQFAEDHYKNAEEAIQENFGFSYNDVGSILGAPDDSEVTVGFDGDSIDVNIEGRYIETMRRTIAKTMDGDIVVMHDEFTKTSDAPKGYATDVLTKAIPNMIEAGVKHITLSAAGSASSSGSSPDADSGDYTGYGVWPRNGFDVSIEKLRSRLKKRVQEKFPKAKMLSDILVTHEGRDWWWSNGGSHTGTFDLAKGSKSIDILGRYALEIDKKRNGLAA